MEILALLAHGFEEVATWQSLLSIILGSALGICIGGLPGLNASMGVALLLPLTYGMTALPAIAMLLSIYCGAIYGGSITAILLSTPGTTAAACTVFDGSALAKKGQPGKALSMAATASFVGGLFSVFVLIFMAPPLAQIALMFSPADYFSLIFFGLSIVSSLSEDHIVKGLMSAVLGLLISTIGIDIISGTDRFTFGVAELLNGVSFIPALIGLFAVSQLFITVEKKTSEGTEGAKYISTAIINLKDFLSVKWCLVRSSVLGTLIGILPGAGATIAAFIAYNEGRRWSKHPEEFGKGCLEGIAAPESANNAATGGAMVPLLTLGIPGSETTAVLVGAFMIQGLRPGPLLFRDNPELVYGLFAALILANVTFYVMGMLGARLFAQVSKIPEKVLIPLILSLAIIGSYAEHNSLVDVVFMFGFAVLGYFMRKFHFPVAPMVLALVLGPMAESNLGRAMVISDNDWSVFYTRPISLTFMIFGLASLLFPIFREIRNKRRRESIHTLERA